MENKIENYLQTIIQLLQSIDSKLDIQKIQSPKSQNITKEIEVIKEVPVEVVKEVEVIKNVPVEVIKEVEVIPQNVQSLLQTLNPYIDLCQAINVDNEIAELLIGRNYNELADSEKLPRLFANASQWDKIVALRELLGSRCKLEKRPTNDSEKTILRQCLTIHNWIFNDRQAQLVTEETGTVFDFKKHERLPATSGDVVHRVLLAGLKNAGDILDKKVLVETE